MKLSPRFATFALLATVAGAAHATDLSLIGSMDGRDFYISANSYNIPDAEALASSVGGSLATISSQAEQDWLLDPSRAGSSDLFWIGYTRTSSGGPFAWEDGSTSTYTNWNGGEPNNLGDERNTVMNWGSDGRWNDWNESNSARVLVTTQAVPEPATMAVLGAGALGLLRRRKR